MQQENHHVASGSWQRLMLCNTAKMSATYFSSARVRALSFGLCLPQGPGTCGIEFSVFACKKRWDSVSERETLIFSARSVEAAVFPLMSGGSEITVDDQVNNCLWIMIFMVRTAKFLSGLVKCAQSLGSVWLFATPMDCILPGFSFHGIFKARKMARVAISCSGILLTQGTNPRLLHLLDCRQILHHWAIGEAPVGKWVSVLRCFSNILWFF